MPPGSTRHCRAPRAMRMCRPSTHSEGYSRKLYSQGGIKPAFVNHQRGVGHAPAPLFHYRGADVQEMLHSLRKEKGDPHEGLKVDFVNPVTGEAVFQDLELLGAAPAPRRRDRAQA